MGDEKVLFFSNGISFLAISSGQQEKEIIAISRTVHNNISFEVLTLFSKTG